MMPIVIDRDLQARLDADGFVVLPALAADVVDELTHICGDLMPVVPAGFFSSVMSKDSALKLELSRRLARALETRLKRALFNYRLLGAVLSSKTPGPESVVSLHQDWTVVDEAQHVAFMVWVPLVDTDQANGTLEVLPGSHRFFTGLRAPTLQSPLKGHEARVRRKLRPLKAKAGDGILIRNSLVHFSQPNLTTVTRNAVVARGCSSEAPLIFHFRDGETPVGFAERLEVDDEFLQRFDDFFEDSCARPKHGRALGLVPYVPSVFSETQVEHYLATIGE